MPWICFCLIGGGWLSQLGVHAHLGHGFVDFAGSSVVHMVGGLAGLMGILVLGPRIGKFRKDGTPKAITGHNIPIAPVGTMILVFGWFGFNAGSTLNGGDLRLAVVATCIVFVCTVMYTFFRVQDRIQGSVYRRRQRWADWIRRRWVYWRIPARQATARSDRVTLREPSEVNSKALLFYH